MSRDVLRTELRAVETALIRAYCLVDLARVASTNEGKEAGVYHGLADASIPDALWIVQEAVHESKARLGGLIQAIEGGPEPDGGGHD